MDDGRNYCFIDFETHHTKQVSLNRMTLREYISKSHITGMAWAFNDDEIQYVERPDADHLRMFEVWAGGPGAVLVAHNAAFDARIWRLMCGLPPPPAVDCTLELAHAVWPNQPGGYGLANLARMLPGIPEKLTIDLHEGKHTPEELDAYCKNDVAICRELHRRELAHIHPTELRLARLTNRVRELHFEIQRDRVESTFQDFCKAIEEAAKETLRILEMGGGLSDQDLFGVDMGLVKSVKPHKIKEILLNQLGFDTETISKKKLNPEKLRRVPKAAEVIEQTTQANQMLAHKRRVATFVGRGIVDMELGYHRAHTGRWSSPQPNGAKGINLHNIPKHNKKIAKPIRTMFRLPEDYCFVRADLANIEYRMLGWLTECAHITALFEKDVLADPYAAFWQASVGQTITKKDPERQIAKKSVLGLNYLMGIGRWITELLIAMADPTFKISVEDLRAICVKQKWRPTTDRMAKAQATKLHAPWEVATVAYHTRELFHQVHPEFKVFAAWLEECATRVSGAVNPERALQLMRERHNAPNPERIYLSSDPRLGGHSIRGNCGNWVPTLCWRDLGVRDTPFGMRLTSIQAGNKGYRSVTKQICIENAAQTASRNALGKGKLILEDKGWPYLPSIHDEIFVVTRRRRDDVLRARDDLIEVFGPGNQLGYGWAVVIDPSEIAVTQSLYEDELDIKPRWARIEAGDADCLENLP